MTNKLKNQQKMNKLNLLNNWAGIKEYFAPRSAQGYLNANLVLLATSGVGSACGSTDGDAKPSACGAGDGDQPKPSACGAGDDPQPKPSACGSSCGSDDK